jgi:hypothetical protein
LHTLAVRSIAQTGPPKPANVSGEVNDMDMLSTIAIVLVVLWLLGYVTAYTMGGFIHILLVLAIVAILIRVIQGRRILS